ncbi:hypothetical protein TYRP_015697 [Tyrophagus putrescentiae]|nr:hypothetical protein TYRP_015697 [Tyrophagus putrescentiae]
MDGRLSEPNTQWAGEEKENCSRANERPSAPHAAVPQKSYLVGDFSFGSQNTAHYASIGEVAQITYV